MKSNDLPKRKPTRLKNYDYSSHGAYFVTICTHNRKQILSHITVGQGLAPAENELTAYGKIAEEQLLNLGKRYANIKIDKYVIMPNHIHIIVLIENYPDKSDYTAGASPCPTLSDVICTYKSLTARLCKKVYPIEKVFQNSFHDHIIRNEKDCEKIWEYIENNPCKWENDCFFE